MAGTGNADKSGGGSSTPIIVALITVAGVMFTALAANWDKIFGGRAPPAMSQSAAATPANDAGVPKDAAQKISDSQKQAYGAATSALDDVTRQIEGAGKPDITGVWADTDGYSFNVRQTGTALSYQEYANGVRVGQGAGEINGRYMRYSFETSEDRGECTGRLSADGSQISGRCRSIEGNSWPFTVVRRN